MEFKAQNWKVNFGQHKGKRFAEVPKDYFKWLYKTYFYENMDKEIKAYIEYALPIPKNNKEEIDFIESEISDGPWFLVRIRRRSLVPSSLLIMFRINSIPVSGRF